MKIISHNILAILLLCVFVLTGCSTLPDRPDLPHSKALKPAEKGAIAELAYRFERDHPAGRSGFRLYDDAQQSMMARLALIDSAQVSIDAQYFIWDSDASGGLLFQRLLWAADRGVRVRLLVDDLTISAKSSDLALASSHPNLEIRLFNPNPARDSAYMWAFQFMTSYQELNRRMHNKLLLVDGQVAIIGGRNIGDAYFGLSEKYNFVDIDMLVVGAVLQECRSAFDLYWNDDIVFPVSAWGKTFSAEDMQAMRDGVNESVRQRSPKLVSYPLTRRAWSGWFMQMEKELITGDAHFVQDAPVKIDGVDVRLVDMITYVMGPAKEEVIIASPYLIPVDGFIEGLQRENDMGIKVKLLTGSLGSNNHTAAHAHYRKYRKPLLATGSELYEFHHLPPADIRLRADVPPVQAEFISLHSKLVVADRERVYIGSLNFDPRAVKINTENGLVIDSPELGRILGNKLDRLMERDTAWQIKQTPKGDLFWEGEEVKIQQPARNDWQRVKDSLWRMMPLESQL